MFDGDCASHSVSVRRLWRSSAIRAVAALMTLAASRTAAGQTASPPPAQPVAGWSDGFFLQTPNGDNRLQIGFVVQADGRFALDDPLPTINTFVLRKARPTFTGRVAKYFDFKITTELAGSVDAPRRLLRHPFLAKAAPAQRQGQDAGRLRAAHQRSGARLPRTLARLAARAEP